MAKDVKPVPAPGAILEAAEHVGRFLRVFDGLKRAMEFLEQHGSILQASAEASARLEKAVSDADAAEARADAAKGEIIKAEARARTIVSDAQARAGVVEARAKEEGDRFIAAARLEAGRITDGAAAAEKAARARAAEIEASVAETAKELAAKAGQLAAIKAELEAVKARLAG
jgi:hypothetical protein